MSNRVRNWVLTINYKDTTPENDAVLFERMKQIDHIRYFVFQLEIGDSGTKHHQMYLSFIHAKSFEFIKNHFPTAHIEEMIGTPEEASNYCKKQDLSFDVSEDIDLSEKYYEWGDLPHKGKRNDLLDIYELLSDNRDMFDIMNEYPSQYLRYRDKLHAVKQDILEERYKRTFRNLSVIYISDNPGVGKTRYVMEKYGYENVYRVSNYKNPFDTYRSEEILLFEEFRESLPIEQMLHYLDGYPLKLPARYSDKVACYKKVYIISNWVYEKQYESYKKQSKETYLAWERRIIFHGNLAEVIKYEMEKQNDS